MKRIAFLSLITIFSITGKSQSTDQNYVRSTAPLLEVSNPDDIPFLGISQKRESINYFDGLGRPVQQIAHRQGPSFEDMVQVMEYDVYGREVKKHLPYAGTSASLNYRTSALSEQAAFYQDKARVAHSQYPYSETLLEASPLNRPLEQSAPGYDWRLDGDHVIKKAYGANVGAEVRLWEYGAGEGVWQSNGFYPAGELYRNQTTDENGVKTLEFHDKRGLLVLKKVQYQAGDLYTETHYIYNDLGLLVAVVPPQAYVDLVTNSSTSLLKLDDPLVIDHIYYYVYDARQRLIEKKIPHKGWEYIVYDNLDRPVATQNAGQRQNNLWSFIKYDKLGRTVITGLLTDNSSRTVLQNDINTKLANATYLNYEEPGGVSYNTYKGYTNQSFPIANSDIYTVSWYDDYDFNKDGTADVNFNTPPSGFYLSTATNRTRSLPTGGLVQVLDGTGSTYLRSATWYDEKGRVIQTEAENHMGGTDRIYNSYNFIGELLRTQVEHSDGSNTHTIDQRFTYDHAGRLLKTYQSIDGQDEIILSSQSYNALGQLTEKDLHGIPYSGDAVPPGWNQKYLQSVDYAYNIRGWLTHINNADLKDDAYNDASASTGGSITAYEFSSLSYKVVEVEEADEVPRHLELWVSDNSEIMITGNLATDHYDNDESARLFLREYQSEDPVYSDLLNLQSTIYSNTYETAHIINASTSVETLQNWLYPEVEAHLEEELTEEEALSSMQQSVFNYVSGKAGHIMEADSIAFPEAILQLTYLEKNAYQLYLKVEGDNTEEAELFIMNKTTSNQSEYNDLLNLTADGQGGYTPLILDFSNVNLTETMGTVEAMEACQAYALAFTAGNNISNTPTTDALNRFGAAYAAEEYGNVYFNNDENDLWGLELKYNSKSSQLGNSNPLNSLELYNGNIAEMHWKSASDQVRRAYGYRYDRLNRITKATYKAYNYNNLLWDQEADRYSLIKSNYDLNGNITKLERKGFTNGTLSNPFYGYMDNLSYTYNGDQLLEVSDAATHYSNDFHDGNQSGTDYFYDENGNMTSDLNKGLTISYNYLNLPVMVSFSDGSTISYLYNATGAKLQKTVTNTPQNNSTVTDYAAIGNYTDGHLDFIFTGEGRAVDDNGSWRYEYYYKDHLGNTRLGFSDYDGNEQVDISEITQQQNYYPFGLEHKGTDYGVATQTTHKYLFQKQELQDELGLGWYSFRWRNSIPELGRFFNTDPLADKYVYNSVYAFSENRVTDGIELEGLEHLSIKRVAQTNGGFQTTITPQSNQELGDLHNSPLQIQYQNYDANNNLVSERTSGQFLYPYERQLVQDRFRLHPHRNGFIDRNNPTTNPGSIQFTTANQSSTTSSSTSSTVTPVINFNRFSATLAPSTSPNIFSNLVGLAPNSTTSSTSGNITTTISSSSTIGISIRSTLSFGANSALFSNRFNTLSSGLTAAGFPASNIINNGVLGRQTPASMRGSVNQVNFNINTTTQTTINSTLQIFQNVRLIGNGTPDTNQNP